MTFTDTTSNHSFACNATLGGTLKSGTGLAGAKIGAISKVSMTGCTVSGFAVSVTATHKPWHLNLSSYASSSGTSSGTISGIEAKLAVSAVGCSGTVAGKTATTPGTVHITYVNSSHTLNIVTTGSTLHAYNTSGCLGLVNNNDALTINGSAPVTPAQTIKGS
jgi:hypothetical protein